MLDTIKLWSPEEQELYYKNTWLKNTISSEFKTWCEKYQERISLISNDIALSYRDLYERVQNLTSYLYEKNFRKGECVLLQMPNSIGFVVTLFALLKIGAVPILALPAQRAQDILELSKIAKPTHYISVDKHFNLDYSEVIEGLKESQKDVEIITFNTEDDPYIELKNYQGKAQDIPEETNNLAIALLLLSGGTTGTPKLIPRTHADYSYNYRKMAEITELNQDSVYLSILPEAHNFSLSCPGIFGILSVGGKLVIANTASFDEGFELISEHKVTITALVPTVAKLWAEAIEWDEPDLSSLKVLQVGGARLEAQDAELITKNFPGVLQQVFGTAEGLICCTRLQDSLKAIINSQGRPISEYDNCLIVDENNQIMPEGEIGELIVKGPYTIHEYYRAGAKNLTAFTEEGYYRMGDLVKKRPDGNFEVLGRIKEQINRAGEKISASEIEKLLLEHEDIESCAVVPVKDQDLGERICAFVIGAEMDLYDLRSYLTEKGLASYKLPDQVLYLENWPLTPVGKIDKKALAKIGLESPI